MVDVLIYVCWPPFLLAIRALVLLESNFPRMGEPVGPLPLLRLFSHNVPSSAECLSICPT